MSFGLLAAGRLVAREGVQVYRRAAERGEDGSLVDLLAGSLARRRNALVELRAALSAVG